MKVSIGFLVTATELHVRNIVFCVSERKRSCKAEALFLLWVNWLKKKKKTLLFLQKGLNVDKNLYKHLLSIKKNKASMETFTIKMYVFEMSFHVTMFKKNTKAD